MSSSDNWCKHYNGTMNETCKVGVKYDSIKDTSQKPYRWICTDLDATATCPSCARKTLEEIAERKKYLNDRLAYLLLAISKIKPLRVKGKTTIGEIECPKCQGRLHYSIAGYNGHVHGQCETKGCLSWME